MSVFVLDSHGSRGKIKSLEAALGILLSKQVSDCLESVSADFTGENRTSKRGRYNRA